MRTLYGEFITTVFKKGKGRGTSSTGTKGSGTSSTGTRGSGKGGSIRKGGNK